MLSTNSFYTQLSSIKTRILRVSTGTWIALSAATLLVATVFWSVFWTAEAVAGARTADWSRASTAAEKTLPVANSVQIFSKILPDLAVWKGSLQILKVSPTCIQQVNQALTPTQPKVISTSQCLSMISTQLASMSTSLSQSWFIKLWLDDYPPYEIKRLADAGAATLQALATGNHRILIILQNADEIRATGGFMGSFIVVDIEQGRIANLETQDIYQPDGQFAGFVEAPPGLNEYLSSGNGWRLPDANWHPDYSQASEDILRFMALGGRQDIDTVIAVNSRTISDLLEVVGPIYLPDYKVAVTAENLTQVARSDRDSFFPGSQQKPNFLSSLLVQLKLRIQSLSNEEFQALTKVLLKNIDSQEILAYSTNSELQKVFERLDIDGQVESDHLPFLYLLESNVGINKANYFVSREVKLDVSTNRITLNITHDNHAPTASSEQEQLETGYVNYQRLVIPSTFEVIGITINSQPIEKWSERLITNAEGLEVKEVGWLVPVPAGKTVSQAIQLRTPDLLSLYPTGYDGHDLSFLILAQPGLPPVPYEISTHGQNALDYPLILEKNTIIKLPL